MLISKFLVTTLLLLLYEVSIAICQGFSDLRNLQTFVPKCPKMYPRFFHQFVPKGNETAGTYIKKPDIHELYECLESCCLDERCNVMFMFKTACYHVSSSEACRISCKPT